MIPLKTLSRAREPNPENILRETFGYDQFRPLQRDVIDSVLARRDTLAIMPTGGGKSLCYQIPALIFPGLTVVVSPLISLMHDQVAQLQGLGVAAAALNSSLEWEVYRMIVNKIYQRRLRLIYMAPETLLTERVQAMLGQVAVDCMTIDEAHCISEWGHDFRPEYRQLAELRQQFPQAACLALTATATPRVRQDIQNALHFKDSQAFVASFDRPNLFLEVQPKQDALAQTVHFLRRFPNQSGIIYCFSRKQVDELAGELAQRGFSARPYHAGMADIARKENQEAFVRDDVQIIVATVAFGMGINKPNVRFVVHYDLPKNIEGYYQEIGRAGRDGLPAHCLLLYSFDDTSKIEYFINQKEEPERANAMQHLQALTRYAESTACRRIPLLTYFGETYSHKNCPACDNCTTSRQPGAQTSIQSDLTEPARLFFSAMRRTGERFGTAHLVDFLQGRASEKILKFGHHHQPGFGSGKHWTDGQWMALSRQLLDQGLVERTEHQGLRLSDRGQAVLATRKTIQGQPPTRQSTTHSRRISELPASREPTKSVPLLDYDVVLFDRLRILRKQIADQERTAPYMVLPDRSLVEMSTYYPMSLANLAKIHGMVQTKLEKYGPRFLQVIQDYGRERALRK